MTAGATEYMEPYMWSISENLPTSQLSRPIEVWWYSDEVKKGIWKKMENYGKVTSQIA